MITTSGALAEEEVPSVDWGMSPITVHVYNTPAAIMALNDAGFETIVKHHGDLVCRFSYRAPGGLWTDVHAGDTVPSIIGVE